MNNYIHIAIAFDKNYLNPFYALAASIFDNNSKVSFVFHCITRDISDEESKQIISYIKKNNSSINFYKVDEVLISEFVTMNHWNTSVYYKIFFPLLVGKEVERILYLDTDTLVLNSLEELYNIDLHDKILGVVKDPHVGKEVYWELHEREDYFNSGVMLIDVKKWNNLDISQKTLKYLNDYPEKIIYVDQDALNVVLENQCFFILEKYNFTYTHTNENATNKQLKETIKNIVIIHFTISRPWHFLCKNRYRYLYKYYIQKSPKNGSKIITDFSFSKIPAYFRMRLLELYFNMPLLMSTWKLIKSKVSI